MNPLESFLEISQWKGSVQEATERVNAAGGDVSLALEQLYSEFLEDDDNREPLQLPQLQSRGTSLNQRNSNLSRSGSSSQGGPPTRSLMDELNSEYVQDLVKNPAMRLDSITPILYILGIPIVSFVASKLADLLNAIGLGQLLTTVQDISVKARESRPRYYKEIILPKINPASAEVIQKVSAMESKSYNDALEQTKSKLGYLLVVLTNETSPQENQMLLGTLQKTGMLTEPQVDLWFASVLDYQGLKVAQSLRFSLIPGLALIGPSPKTAQSNIIVMECLYKSEGVPTGPTLSIGIRSAMANHETKLMSLRLERQQFDVDRHIREEQDNAYQRSLEADRKRAQDAKAEKIKIEEEKSREESLAELHEQWQRSVIRRARVLQKQPTDSAKFARIGVRFPNGQRISMNLPSGTTIDDLYCLVFAHMNNADIDEGSDFTVPVGYKPKYGFGLVSPVLRRTLLHDSTPIEQIGTLWPSGVVMVDMD